jgi:hypothetical protein
VGGFFYAISHELLPEILVIFDSGRAVAGGRGDDVPFFDNFRIFLGLLGSGGVLGAEQLPAGLVPIRVGKFIRITLRDHRDLAGPLLHGIGRGHSHAVAMH